MSDKSPPDLFLGADAAEAARAASRDWPSWDLTARQLCDLELLMVGAFAPLDGFMDEATYASVCQDMRLPSGALWPMPICLDVPEDFAEGVAPGQSVALRDAEGVMLAALHVTAKYRPDREAEAKSVFGTTDQAHPGVAHLLSRTHPVYLGGRIEALQAPGHYDFRHLRRTPAETRALIKEQGWDRVVAFQTRNPMHRAHFELTLRAAQEHDAKLLVHPVVGLTKPGDVDHFTRVRCYEALLEQYPKDTALLSLLPLAMRMGGPREALWHALIRKNYGCTHLIVGRDHAGPGNDASGKPFYGPYDAQEILSKHQDEIGIQMVPFKMMMYVPSEDRYAPVDELQAAGKEGVSISGTELRAKLSRGDDIPAWFTFPKVVEALRHRYPPRREQGVCVFFTGLSGSGKSTVANALAQRLSELDERSLTLLDGDLVRKNLSSELGFSKEHRDLNIRRIGFVASEITKNGGFALCAPIAPYDAVRKEVRSLVEARGAFVLVHISTPLEACEARDRKGLYAKARAGIIKEFTGISDPYEAPEDAQLAINTDGQTVEACVEKVVDYLREEGFIG